MSLARERFRRGRVVPWTPYSIPLSLRPLYLSAADLASTPVSSWTGRQGGLALTATGSPAWSATGLAGAYPMVSGDGVGAYLGVESTTGLPTGTDPCVFLALADVGGVDGNKRLVSYGSTSSTTNRRLDVSSTEEPRVASGGVAVTGNVFSSARQPHVLVGILTATEAIIRVDGQEEGRLSGVIGTTGTTRLRLFTATTTSPTSFFAGGITELLICTTLTERQILQFEGYCAHAYPLAGINLPDSHPYKYSAP